MRHETSTQPQRRDSRVDVILDLIDRALAEYDEAAAEAGREPALASAA